MKNKSLAKFIRGYFLTALTSLLVVNEGWSQASGSANTNFYDRFLANGMLLFAFAIIVGAVVALFHLLNVMIKMQQLKIYQEQGFEEFLEAKKQPRKDFWNRLYNRWTNVVPVEKEEDIMFDHAYDGIRELDNSLPPWWVAMFYLTIAFAVVYFGYYHVTGMGMSSSERYEQQMQKAEDAVAEYLSKQANLVDETNVTVLTDENELAMGKTVYDMNCLACHGALGEGGVGPNFTDQYWIHGGDIKDLFRTIKYGVPEKGMISWKSQLSPSDMHRVASFILTLQGTNPPGAKEPQGELYIPPTASDTDTTANSETIGMLSEQ